MQSDVKKPVKTNWESRRVYSQEFKENDRWKKGFLGRENGVALDLEQRVRELEAEPRRVESDRDLLKKALSIFGRDG